VNDVNGMVDRQVDSMLKLLRRHESGEIEKILDRAYATATERVRTARREARLRVHEAIRELRGEVDTRMTRVRAGNQAEERQRDLEKARQVLAEGDQLLRERVAARWEEAEARRRWTASLLDSADRILPPGEWSVTYAPGWPEAEREAFSTRVTEIAGCAPQLSCDEDIAAGLRIRRGTATLDGTLQGLMARGEEIEARLLAAYYSALAQGADRSAGEAS
jgi:hypothetical protein